MGGPPAGSPPIVRSLRSNRPPTLPLEETSRPPGHSRNLPKRNLRPPAAPPPPRFPCKGREGGEGGGGIVTHLNLAHIHVRSGQGHPPSPPAPQRVAVSP